MLIEGLVASHPLRVESDVGTVMTYLGMNLTDRILANAKVREAMALAIDRDEIIAHRFRGLAEKANSILSPRNWAYDPDLAQIPFDPARATKLLDEAGYPDPDGDGPGVRFELVSKTSTVKERIEVAQMIAHQLAKVGIGVRVAPYEWGTFFRDIRNGNVQLYTLSWVGVFEPDILYEVCDSRQTPPAGLNRGRYQNAEVDKLVRAARAEMDQGKRKELYAKVQRILLSELPFVPLWYEKNVVVFRKGLSGVRVRADASYRTLLDVEVKGE